MYRFILAFTSINILFSPNVVLTNVFLLYCANEWAVTHKRNSCSLLGY